MLIQAGKMATLGEMATGIAHELNQPLNVIRLGCDYMTKIMKTGGVLSTENLKNVSKESHGQRVDADPKSLII